MGVTGREERSCNESDGDMTSGDTRDTGAPGASVEMELPGEIRDLRLRSLLRQPGSHCEQFITPALCDVCEHHNITGRDKMILTSRGS